MEPPIAVYKDGKVGFGLGSVVLDLDPDHTPPEILRFFGTDESFTGLYVQSARIYVSDVHKGYGFHVGVQDLLISFDGEVSFEVSADVLGPEVTLSAKLVVSDQGRSVEVDAGDRTGASTTTATVVEGGSFTASTAALVQVEVTGGQPPHTVTVTPDAGGSPRFDAATGRVKVDDLAVGDRTLTLQVTDSSGQSYTETLTMHVTAAPPAPTAATAAGSAADRPRQQGDLPPLTPTGGTSVHHAIVPAGTVTGTRERFRLTGPGTPTVTAGGTPVDVVDGHVEVDVPEGTTNLQIVPTWPALSGTPQAFDLRFTKAWPKVGDWDGVRQKYVDDTADLGDLRYPTSRAPGQALGGTAALRAWLDDLAAAAGGVKPTVTITASASWESDNRQDEDQALSDRRRDVAVAAVGSPRHARLHTHCDRVRRRPGRPAQRRRRRPQGGGHRRGHPAQRDRHAHRLPRNPARPDRRPAAPAAARAAARAPAEQATRRLPAGRRPGQGDPQRPGPVGDQRPPRLRDRPRSQDAQPERRAGHQRQPAAAPAARGRPPTRPATRRTGSSTSGSPSCTTRPPTRGPRRLAIGAHPDDVNGLLQMTQPAQRVSRPPTPGSRTPSAR